MITETAIDVVIFAVNVGCDRTTMVTVFVPDSTGRNKPCGTQTRSISARVVPAPQRMVRARRSRLIKSSRYRLHNTLVARALSHSCAPRPRDHSRSLAVFRICAVESASLGASTDASA